MNYDKINIFDLVLKNHNVLLINGIKKSWKVFDLLVNNKKYGRSKNL